MSNLYKGLGYLIILLLSTFLAVIYAIIDIDNIQLKKNVNVKILHIISGFYIIFVLTFLQQIYSFKFLKNDPIFKKEIIEKIKNGDKAKSHTASMAEMGAACIASAGKGLLDGQAASMTVYPIIPDKAKYGQNGRDTNETYGEIGLSAHWMKHMLHYLFIYKAKALPFWYLIPE